MLQHLPCLNNIARFRSWQIVLWGCVDVNIASIRGEGWKELFASLLGTVILLLKKKKKEEEGHFSKQQVHKINQTGAGIVFMVIHHFNQCFTSLNPQA